MALLVFSVFVDFIYFWLKIVKPNWILSELIFYAHVLDTQLEINVRYLS